MNPFEGILKGIRQDQWWRLDEFEWTGLVRVADERATGCVDVDKRVFDVVHRDDETVKERVGQI